MQQTKPVAKKWLQIPAAVIRFLFEAVDRFFTRMGPVVIVLFHGRVCLLVTILGVSLLGFTEQGKEIGRTGADFPIWFIFAVFISSFVNWLWLRVIFDQEYDSPLNGRVEMRSDLAENLKLWLTWLPRLVGTVPLLLAAWLLFQAGSGYWIVSAMIGAGFGWLVWSRRKLTSWIVSAVPKGSRIRSVVKGAIEFSAKEDNPAKGVATFSMKIVFYCTLILAVIFILLCIFIPVQVGVRFGAGAVTFLACAAISILFSYAIYWANIFRKEIGARYYFPVLTVFIALGLITASFSDGYDVRKLLKSAETAGEQIRLGRSLEKWNSQAEDQPMIVVATAGGALRAAYWTGTVLGALEDAIPGIHKQVFAISAVSGGGYGATAYVASIKEANASSGPWPGYELRIQDGLKRDFLGPVIASLLTTDTIFSFLRPFGTTNRANSLEQAWEQGWQQSKTRSDSSVNPFAADFRSLWSEERSWPVLLLNGTHQQTGRRIITSNVDTDGWFTDAYDFFKLRPNPIPASTAVHNSARFPYVSPAGSIKTTGDTDEKHYGHIVDGGYFENYGAETAFDLISEVRLRYPSRKIIVIQIVSDPGLREEQLADDCRGPHSKLPKPDNLYTSNSSIGSTNVGQLSAPITAFLQTREARGINAAKRLRCKVFVDKGDYFLFSMEADPQIEPTLSWYLPKDSAEVLRKLLRRENGSQAKNFERLLRALGADDKVVQHALAQRRSSFAE